MIDLLQKFQKVIEIGNVTQAAKDLYITQPALTQSLQQLEKELGGKLLLRSRRGVKPTRLGSIVYKQSKTVTREEKNLRIIVQEELRKESKFINMGMIDNVGLIFISNIYNVFLEKNPHLKLQIEVNNSDQLISQIENDIIDFAIITRPAKILPDIITVEKFANEEMVIVGKKHLIQKIKKIKDLEEINFISYNKNSNTHAMILRTCIKNRLDINFLAFSSSPTFILQMVKQGSGIAALPRNIVESELANNELVEFRHKNLIFFRELSLIKLRNTYLAETTMRFLDELKENFK